MEPVYEVSMIGTSETLTEYHLELLTIKNDALYVRYDTFGYLALFVFMLFLLTWTLINFALHSFRFGYF